MKCLKFPSQIDHKLSIIISVFKLYYVYENSCIAYKGIPLAIWIVTENALRQLLSTSKMVHILFSFSFFLLSCIYSSFKFFESLLIFLTHFFFSTYLYTFVPHLLPLFLLSRIGYLYICPSFSFT